MDFLQFFKECLIWRKKTYPIISSAMRLFVVSFFIWKKEYFLLAIVAQKKAEFIINLLRTNLNYKANAENYKAKPVITIFKENYWGKIYRHYT